MKKTSKPIVFFGNERLATGVQTKAPTLTRLIESGYSVAAVIASNDYSASRKQRRLEIAEVADKYGIPVLLPKRLSDIRGELGALEAEIGVLVAYGKMVPQSIIDLFPKGIINIHPSLLPLHRGPTPIESVILNGEIKTGVSLMSLVKEMDAGPIYHQKTVDLTGTETKQQLADDLIQMGGDMLLSILPAVLGGNIKPKAQNDSKATYDALIGKKDGTIDWQKPAEQIEREIRAYATWPGSRTVLANKDVIIIKAQALSKSINNLQPGAATFDKETYCILAATKKGLLAIERLKPIGKKEMPASAFVAGHPQLRVKT